jgi:hypothetical protein
VKNKADFLIGTSSDGIQSANFEKRLFDLKKWGVRRIGDNHMLDVVSRNFASIQLSYPGDHEYSFGNRNTDCAWIATFGIADGIEVADSD